MSWLDKYQKTYCLKTEFSREQILTAFRYRIEEAKNDVGFRPFFKRVDFGRITILEDSLVIEYTSRRSSGRISILITKEKAGEALLMSKVSYDSFLFVPIAIVCIMTGLIAFFFARSHKLIDSQGLMIGGITYMLAFLAFPFLNVKASNEAGKRYLEWVLWEIGITPKLTVCPNS